MPESNNRYYRRLGIFGGGFDPVHLGHIQIASELSISAEFELLLVVPGLRPPHKPKGYVAPFSDRLKMAQLAFASHSNTIVSEIEATLTGPGYSLSLVREIKRQFKAEMYCLCLGADQFRDLPNWHHPEQLAREVVFCVGNRPGESLDSLTMPFPVQVEKYATSLNPVSASSIRKRVSEGISESELADLVPPAVAAYIVRHALYRAAP